MKKMTEGPIVRQLLVVSGPILLGQLLQQLYNIVDTMIVGRYLGVNALAAVGSTWALNYIVKDFCIGTCMGIGVPLSQAYGAGDQHKLRCCFINSIYFVIGLAVCFTVMASSMSRQFLIWLQTPEAILKAANEYLFIIFLGLPCTIIYNFCFGVLMAFGDSRRTSLYMAVSTVINLILDIWFVAGLHMGVSGAALATVISELVAGFCSVLYIVRKYPKLFPKQSEWKFSLKYFNIIIKMSVPMGLQYSVTAIGALILQYSVNHLGEEAVAAYSTGSKVKGLLLCPLNALGTALSSYSGQNFGAGKIDRIKSGVLNSCLLGTAYSAMMIIVSIFASEPIALLFLDSENTQVIFYVKEFIIWISVFLVELNVLFMVRYTVQGMGYGRYSIYSAFAEMLGRSFMAVFVIPRYGFRAVCISEGITFLAGILVIVPIYFYLIKKYCQAV